MYFLPLLKRWSVRLGFFNVVVGSAIASLSFTNALGNTTLAQVVPDNTLGTENSAVTNSGNVDAISGGATRGGNLFHSFDSFSVQSGRTARFDNAASIQNIISRVTGSSVSNIDGTIAAGGTANLFLLNPNGIVFGQNARLNIGGSFIGTTARSIDFADGTQFSATPGSGAPLLTVNVPVGLQFGNSAGNIINRASGVGLQVNPGRTLGLVGGNVSLDSGNLSAAGGRIELGAVAAPGVVGVNSDSTGFRFSFPTDLVLSDISLSNGAVVFTVGGGGGSIAVNARNLSLTAGSQISSGIDANQGTSGAVAGDVEINARDTVTIDGTNSRRFTTGIGNSTRTASNSGNIRINTGSFNLLGSSLIGSGTFGRGNAGSVNITARDRVTIAGGSSIASLVGETSEGNGSNINIQAGSLFLSDGAGLTTSTLGLGNAGNIEINVTDSVVASGGSLLQANSFNRGNAGNITVTAGGSISFDGIGTDNIRSGISSNLFQIPEFQGDRRGGNINVRARSLSLSNGAELTTESDGQGNAGNIEIGVTDSVVASGGSLLSATSFGRGDGGNVTVTAGDRVSLDNINIFSSLGQTAIGVGGDINIKARSLSLSNNSGLTTSTFGQGNAGSISLQIDNAVELTNSAIFSSVNAGAVGDGGTIDIKAGSLSLTDGAQIQAPVRAANDGRAGGRGNGGRVIIDVRDAFSASGSNSRGNLSGVFTSVGTGAVGNGGSIDLTAGTLSLDRGATMNARTFGQGNGGSINLKARTLLLDNGATMSASTFGQGNAGSISLQIDDTAVLANGSSIFSSVATGAVGNGSTIDIQARSLSLSQGAQIIAAIDPAADGSPGGRGNGGRVIIDVRDAFSASGRDTTGGASGVFTTVGTEAEGKGGDIEIKAGTLSLENGAVLNAGTFGTGNAGSILLRVDNSISLSNSLIFSSVAAGAVGNGSTIDIQARSLSLSQGAEIIAAIDSAADGLPGGRGNGGRVVIDVRDRFSASGSNASGNPSGVFTTVGIGAVGDGGTIDVIAGSLTLFDLAQLSTSNLGQGNAGNINVDVRTLNLDRGGIFAATASGDGGDIRVQASRSVRLRNGSQISTSAGGTGQPGNGGNITIDSPLVIANTNGNNNITANAFNGRGGRIEINAQSIFGLAPRSRQELQDLLGTDTPTAADFLNALDNLSSNDVAAISLTDPALSGTVSFNAADIDPSRDIVELPTGLVDAAGLVAAGCPSGAENRFTVAGRGGLPPAPGDKLSPDAILTDWAIQTPKTENRAAVETTSPVASNTTATPLVEASSWQFDRNGAIMLTSNTTSPNRFEATPTSCPSS